MVARCCKCPPGTPQGLPASLLDGKAKNALLQLLEDLERNPYQKLLPHALPRCLINLLGERGRAVRAFYLSFRANCVLQRVVDLDHP